MFASGPGGQVPCLSPRPPPCTRPPALEAVPFGTALSPSRGTLATPGICPLLLGGGAGPDGGGEGGLSFPVRGPTLCPLPGAPGPPARLC